MLPVASGDFPTPGPAKFVWFSEDDLIEEKETFLLKEGDDLLADLSYEDILSSYEIGEGGIINADNDLEAFLAGKDVEVLEDDPIVSVQRKKSVEKQQTTSDALKCLRCDSDEFFTDGKEAMDHILQLHPQVIGDNFAECTFCLTRLSHEQSLRKHLKGVHFKVVNYECPYCRRKIVKRSDLNRHIQNWHKGKKLMSETAKLFHCDECLTKFFKKERRDKHVTTAHRKVKAISSTETQESSESESMKENRTTNIVKSSTKKILKAKDASENAMKSFIRSNLYCKVCSKKCDSVQAKKAHLREIHENLHPIDCALCQATLWSLLHFKVHMKSHTKEKALNGSSDDSRCSICNQTFDDNEKLLKHVKKLHAYQCPDCPEYFQSQSDVQEHLENGDHFTKHLYSCVKCGNNFVTKSEAYVHVKKEHQSLNDSEQEGETQTIEHRDLVKISILKKPGSTNNTDSAGFKINEKVPSNEEHARLSETVCEEQSNIEEYPPTDPLNQNDPLYKCPVCFKMFKARSSVRKHCRIFHPRVRTYFCCTCFLVFTKMDKLRKHVCGKRHLVRPSSKLERDAKSKAKIEDDLKFSKTRIIDHSSICTETESAQLEKDERHHGFKCPMCSSRFEVLGSLRKHCRLSHEIKAIKTCTDCVLVFVNDEDRLQHNLKAHNDPPTSKRIGNKGGRTVSRKSTNDSDDQRSIVLRENTKENTDSLPGNGAVSSKSSVFQCPFCPTSFVLRDRIRRHSKKMHNQSLNTCRFCTQVFLGPKLRDEHVNSAHASLPNTSLAESRDALEEKSKFSCPVCKKGYRSKPGLRHHFKMAHRTKNLLFCKKCPRAFSNKKVFAKHVVLCRKLLISNVGDQNVDFHGFDEQQIEAGILSQKSLLDIIETEENQIQTIEDNFGISFC